MKPTKDATMRQEKVCENGVWSMWEMVFEPKLKVQRSRCQVHALHSLQHCSHDCSCLLENLSCHNCLLSPYDMPGSLLSWE